MSDTIQKGGSAQRDITRWAEERRPKQQIKLRLAVFADREESDWAKAAVTGRMLMEHLPSLLPPAQEVDLLCEAGFTDVELYYAAFSFRGWVGTAGSPS
ncbi:MAG: hypothetical protein JJ969_12755 [Rhizobiaceae bacterium]|nr:hypothetical protein [Rhizobiaceae bacterium]